MGSWRVLYYLIKDTGTTVIHVHEAVYEFMEMNNWYAIVHNYTLCFIFGQQPYLKAGNILIADIQQAWHFVQPTRGSPPDISGS